MQIDPIQAPADNLLLDPNNYRFHDIPGYRQVPGTRYAEKGVQDRALQLLQDTDSFDLESLKDSILTNGFVPLEQIVVQEFDELEGVKRYLVIEGNRRVAAVKTLLSEHEAGAVTIPEEKINSLKTLSLALLQGEADEMKSYQQTLMAIRHVAGIREWGPYQQAKLIVEMFEGGEGTFTKVAQRIGTSAMEVGRRYRASKALQQMEEDEEFGANATPKLYTFFHEAISQPKVRDWLEFSDATFRAQNDDARRAFYELLSPSDVDGERKPPKLQNATTQVRLLKNIVDKPHPLGVLLDPEKNFDDALSAATEETVRDESGVLERSLSVALQSLRNPGIDSWAEPSERALELWSNIKKIFNQIDKMMTEHDTEAAT